jgi:hypothetical protein
MASREYPTAPTEQGDPMAQKSYGARVSADARFTRCAAGMRTVAAMSVPACARAQCKLRELIERT